MPLPRPHRMLRQAALLLGCLLAPLAQSAPKPVQDLAYGQALFHFYQDDYLTALTLLLAAQDTGKLRHHALDGELLIGGMQLSYGLHVEAEAIFRRLLDASLPAPVRNRAWYYLGRIAYEKGQPELAERALARVDAESEPELAGERQLLLALARLQRDDPTGAAAALEPWRGEPRTAGYARYNLGLAQLRQGLEDKGIATLEALGRDPAASEEQWALRDKTNLALGYHLIQRQDYRRARAAFERVRQDSPFASRALLGLGWLETAAGRHAAALAPLTLLQSRPLDDPAVQEALLALPHVHARLGDKAGAAALYRDAIAGFERELQRLRDAEDAVRAGALPDADGRLPADLPGRPYLVEVTAGHDFQQGLKTYRELLGLRANLLRWQASITSFDDMLLSRETRYAATLPAAERLLAELDVEALQRRRAALHAEFERIVAAGDAPALAIPAERARWHEIDALLARLDALPADHPQLPELRERALRLKGVLLWSLEAAYPQRSWDLRKALRGLDTDFRELDDRRAALLQARVDAERRFAGYRLRIAEAHERIARLLPQTERLLAIQAEDLQQRALAALHQRRLTLERQLSQARFGLAWLYDEAASRGETP